jgi:hypothetical protein
MDKRISVLVNQRISELSNFQIELWHIKKVKVK